MNFIASRPPRIALLFLMIAAVLQFLFEIGDTILFSSPGIGLGLFGTGFLMMMWAWWIFKRQKLAVCFTARATHITTEGPYRLTRNPMYLGMVLMMAGTAFFFGTLPFSIAALVYFILLNGFFCPSEENTLERAFGAEYLEYKNRVRRWI